MFSILKMGSKQYNISLGSRIRVEKLNVMQGSTWSSKEVLAFQDDKGAFTFGTPLVSKAEVRARVVCHGKTKKVLILKKKRRKGYRRTQGHRQNFTELFIEALANPQGKWHEVSEKEKTRSVQTNTQKIKAKSTSKDKKPKTSNKSTHSKTKKTVKKG